MTNNAAHEIAVSIEELASPGSTLAELERVANNLSAEISARADQLVPKGVTEHIFRESGGQNYDAVKPLLDKAADSILLAYASRKTQREISAVIGVPILYVARWLREEENLAVVNAIRAVIAEESIEEAELVLRNGIDDPRLTKEKAQLIDALGKHKQFKALQFKPADNKQAEGTGSTTFELVIVSDSSQAQPMTIIEG